ncbi:DoxX family protein [Conexibacter sp. DBS9H8]|uniref:DoxX family protein n=1 Tax=Conexibacter sp. DBS9H8 TaxID=2937801 RepID=UPI00200CE17D|nr:DoxX family protein [Conexibacter sp. DBS9H8]
MKVGTLLLRGTIGGFFVGHGAQKLFGVAGGHGLKGTAQYFEGLGLRPGLLHASAAGLAETGGGLGLLLGYRTPLAASAVVSTMITAIHRVHLKNGWTVQAGGYEYNAVLIAGAVAIAEQGPGVLSLDALRGKQRSGLRCALFALTVGAAGAAAANAAAGGLPAAPAPVAPAPAPAAEPAPVSEPPVTLEATPEPADAPMPVTPVEGDAGGV